MIQLFNALLLAQAAVDVLRLPCTLKAQSDVESDTAPRNPDSFWKKNSIRNKNLGIVCFMR